MKTAIKFILKSDRGNWNRTSRQWVNDGKHVFDISIGGSELGGSLTSVRFILSRAVIAGPEVDEGGKAKTLNGREAAGSVLVTD